MAKKGVPLAEVNLDTSGATDICKYIFQAGHVLPADYLLHCFYQVLVYVCMRLMLHHTIALSAMAVGCMNGPC